MGFLSNLFSRTSSDRSYELESSIIRLKSKILVTEAYAAGIEYERLYWRLTDLMSQILERHIHFVLNIEAKGMPTYEIFRVSEHRGASGEKLTSHYLPSDLDLERYDPDLLIYLCFFIWFGGRAKGVGSIDSNPELLMGILDYLIAKINYAPAFFFKGMVRKYGLQVYSECFPSEAKSLLQIAQKNGVGSATLELANIDRYAALEGKKSVQLSERIAGDCS